MIGSSLLILAVLLGATSSAIAATLPFTLDGVPGGGSVSLTAPGGGGRATTTLIRTTAQGAPETIGLLLSQFAGEQGNPVSAKLIVTGAVEPKPKPDDPYEVKVTTAAIPLQIEAGELPTAGKYTGTLTMIADKFDPLSWKVVLTGTGVFRPAVLVVDRGNLTTSVTTCPWFACLAPAPRATSVHLSDKNRQWPLEGVTLRQEASAKTSEFDLDRNLKLALDGKDIARAGDLDGVTRVVPRGHPATMSLTPRDLSPGEYNATLRFQAVNSADDDGQKLLLTVLVRHCMFWAVIVLVLALLVSFVVTKVLVMLRQRLAFLVRVRDLRAAWLSKMDPVLPVVWVRAMLRQSEDLSRRYWLTGQSLIDTRLNHVSGVLGVLDKVQQLRRGFDQPASLHSFVKVRAVTALNRIVSRMNAGAMSDQEATLFTTELDGLSAWILKTEECYWEDVVKAAKELAGDVKPQEVPSAGQAEVAALKTKVEGAIAAKPNDLAGMIAVESDYARLKILWERRQAPEFTELIALQQLGRPLDEFFVVADAAAWRRLQADAAREIVLPQDTGAEPLESHTPLTFALRTPTDRAVGETYLFLHGLTYKWMFELTHRKRHWRKLWRKPRPPVKFSAISTEPQAVVFAPDGGRLTVSVSATYNGGTMTTAMANYVPIVESRDYTVDKGFERVELWSFGIAGALALASGLSLLYAKNATFGTMADYFGLMLWGVGVDQGKNLAQSLQLTSPPPKTP
jgi:hypothetical protein